MSDIDVVKVKEWLDTLPGGSLVDDFAENWRQFDAATTPVVTVFGSYDTGKSSLIRRLLVDNAVPVPDWLTISARHETFEVKSVELAGSVLRDTPGLAVGADDVRGRSNTALASAAISATDIAIVTVTSQLATGEFEFLREIVEVGWTSENLWFVISRFDEAGIDPDDDLDGYRQLAARKRAELADSLKLSSNYPVHVVSQDFSQIAGATRDVGAEVWDESREWDGMDVLGAAIKDVALGDVVALRASTEQRYWRQAVRRTVAELRAQLVECEPLLAPAEVSATRRELWKDSLNEVDIAARADLKGALGKAARLAFAGGDHDPVKVTEDLNLALTDWYGKHARELDRLLQDVARSDERQRKEQSWKKLDDLASWIAADADPAPEARIVALAPHVSKFGSLMIDGLREFEKSQLGGSLKRASRGGAAASVAEGVGSLGKGLAVASALLPLVVEIAKELDQSRANQASVASERQALRVRENKLIEQVNAIALVTWDEAVAETMGEIDAASEQAELADGLHDSIAKLRTAIKVGEGIL